MRRSHIFFVLGRVGRSLKELLWTHVLTSGTMAMTLFIFGGFILLQENLQGWLRGWGSQIQIFAYLKDDLDSGALEELRRQISSYPEVERVRYISKRQAWSDFKKALGSQAGVLHGMESDILPSSLEIVLLRGDRQRTFMEGVAARLQKLDGVVDVEYPEEWLEKLSLLLLGVQWAKWVFGGFLFMATLLIVGNTVKLAIVARREEIEIMQLVGAKGSLIKAPFVLEGMIQGLGGAAVSVLLLWLLFVFLKAQLPSSFGILLPREGFQFLDFRGIGIILALGWAMGAAGSLLSLRRFMRT